MNAVSRLFAGLIALCIIINAQAGNILYAVDGGSGNNSSSLLIISNYSSSPTIYEIGESGVLLFDVAVDPTSCRIYGLGELGQFYELNPTNGVAQYIGSMWPPNSDALEFDRSGQAYAWESGKRFYRVNKSDGTIMEVGRTGFQSGGDLAFDVDGTLYGAAREQLVRIDPATAAGLEIGPLPQRFYGLEIDTDGSMYMVGRDGIFYSVDKTTAAITAIGILRMGKAIILTNKEPIVINGLSFWRPAEPPPAPVLSIAKESPDVRLSWPCQCVDTYRVEYSLGIGNDPWLDLNLNITGIKDLTSVLIPMTNSAAFFRLKVLSD